MGRRKITIKRIAEDRNRQVTLNKRRAGLMKKAYELSVLCDCQIALVIFDGNNRLYEYASHDLDSILERRQRAPQPYEEHDNTSLKQSIDRKGCRQGAPKAEALPAPPVLAQLTPNTERKHRQINEEFARMISQQGVQPTPHLPQHMQPPARGQRRRGSLPNLAAAASSSSASGASFSPMLVSAASGEGAAVAMGPPMAAGHMQLQQQPLRRLSSASSSGSRGGKKRPSLKVHIPGSGKQEYPPGTLPRTQAAAARHLVSGLPMLSPARISAAVVANECNNIAALGFPTIPTPSILQAAGLANLSSATLNGLSMISPLWAASPSGSAIINWPLTSPSVLHTSQAGDIHLSSQLTAQHAAAQAHTQQAHVAQVEAALTAAAAIAQLKNLPSDASSCSSSSSSVMDGQEPVEAPAAISKKRKAGELEDPIGLDPQKRSCVSVA